MHLKTKKYIDASMDDVLSTLLLVRVLIKIIGIFNLIIKIYSSVLC